MTKCSVKNCTNSTKNSHKRDGISFFHFPVDPIRSAEWTAIISRDRGDPYYKPKKSCVICSVHFPVSEMYTTNKGLQRLSKTAYPLLQMSEKKVDVDIKEEEAEAIPQASHIAHEAASIQGPDLEANLNDLDTKVEQTLFANIGLYSDSPRNLVLTRKLTAIRKLLYNKNKQINTLQKQNRRLKNRNTILKRELKLMKKNEQIFKC